MVYKSCLSRSLAVLFVAVTSALLFGCGGGYGGGNGGGGGNPPAAPTGLTATAGNGQVSLSWTASSGATGYYVNRSTTAGGETRYATVSATTYTDNMAANGTTYYYKVSAYNSYGEGANSSEVSATPTAGGTKPPAPTGLTATAGNGSVALSWNASSGATGYNVLRGITSGGETQLATTTSTTYTDSTAANSTKYYYVVQATNAAGTSGNSNEVNATPTAPPTAVNVTIDTLANRHSISQYVYGGSFPECTQVITDSGLTVVRWGGNGSSEYNWKLGTTNADNDYFFEDFNWKAWSINPNQVPSPPCPNPVPAQPDSVKWIGDVHTAGSVPLTTMAMLNWVAQSPETAGAPPTGNGHWSFSVKKYGTQCKVDPYNTDAGNGIPAPTGPSDPNCTSSNPTLLTADPNDAYFPLLDDHSAACPAATCEYRSDWATALAGAFNTAGTPHFYDMDNEIDIWGGTHRDIHPNPATYNELRDVYLTEAAKMKTWDPMAIRLGPVSCCWYFYWRSATDGNDTTSHGGVDFLPWWLNEVAWSDAISGSRTLDVFDIHAYPDADTKDNKGNSLPTSQLQALAVKIYRDWWDPTFPSAAGYIRGGGFSIEPKDSIPFRIPRMRAILNQTYPGTQFSITEWSAEFAGGSDFSTALGDADAYGILGRERVYLSTRWTAPSPANPNYQALKLYTNYDGAHHGFGTLSVSDTNDGNPDLFSSYAALDSTGKTLTIMVLNKDPQNSAQVQFALNGFTATSFVSYTLASTAPTTITKSSSPLWSASQTFAPYSATLLVITGSMATTPASDWDLNPDTIMVPAGGTVILQPKITTTGATKNITLSSAVFGVFGVLNGLPACTGGSITLTNATITPSQPGTITVIAPTTPGFCYFSVTGSDQVAIQNESGWIVVGNPAAALDKTSGDGQTGTAGTALPTALTVTLSPSQSGGTASGASILFTTSAGSLSNGTSSGSKVIAITNSSGVASVTLTLPSTKGSVTVTAEGPYGLGHPVAASFTETAN